VTPPVPPPALPEPSVAIAALLGLIQGLTEFLPVSSSGHLVIAQALLRARSPGITLEIVLHAGTLCAVVVAYRKDLFRLLVDALGALRDAPHQGWSALRRARELGWLVLATVPAALAGLALQDRVEAVFERPRVTALLLCVTGLLLLATHAVRRRRGELGVGRVIAMGLMQAVSLLPGISRCGATLSGGLFAGGRPEAVVRFSFLMSVPAILGSLVVHLRELAAASEGGGWLSYAVGFAVAFVCGLLAIRVLLRTVARGRLYLFGIYCLVVGLGGWFWLGGR